MSRLWYMNFILKIQSEDSEVTKENKKWHD